MQVQEVLNYQNGPLITIIYDLLINSKVFIQRKGNIKKISSQKGLFKLFKVSGEIYILQLLYGPTKFRTMAIKLFYLDNLTSLNKPNLLLNLPTILQDKEVKLDIKPEIY